MSTAPTPQLLKARRKHTQLCAILLLPVLVMTGTILPTTSFDHQLIDWLGYFLVILCVLGRSYSSLFVGGKKNDVLVTEGVFSIVRNPLYVFSFIGLIGIGLESGKITIVLLLVTAFYAYYKQVVAREEQFLQHKFGSTYDAYVQNVPRWIPNFSRWYAAKEITVNPTFVLRTMRDAAVFFVALPFFELLEGLQETGIVHAYINLP